MNNAAKMLESKGVGFAYPGGKTILADFNFSLDKGEFAGLIGPNGAGKTTIFRVLSGYIKPSSGKVMAGECDVHKLSSAERAELIAVVPQNIFSPLPYTVKEIVEMGRISKLSRFKAPSAEDRKRIFEAMEKMDVLQHSNDFFNNLSGGEKQRTMIAAALAQEPEVLLLDEPTSQLDIGHTAHLMKLLEDLNKEHGITVMLISHDIQTAARFCPRLLLLKDGKIIADGGRKTVMNKELIGNAYNCKVDIIEDGENGRIFISPG